MNKVIISGNLTKDPETRQAATTNVTRFTVAVNRRRTAEGEQLTDFINCVSFGKSADFIAKYFHKGMKILLEGRIQTGSYEKDGVKHYTTEVITESAEFGEKKASTAETEINKASEEFMPIPEGEQIALPFD